MKKQRKPARAIMSGTNAPKWEPPPPPVGLERLFTISQIAQLGGPCRAKLYNDIKLGKLRAIKFGRSTRISESAYRAYLEAAPSL
jgi:excisionase family DNA binding protein